MGIPTRGAQDVYISIAVHVSGVLRKRGCLKSPVREEPALSVAEGPHAGILW